MNSAENNAASMHYSRAILRAIRSGRDRPSWSPVEATGRPISRFPGSRMRRRIRWNKLANTLEKAAGCAGASR